MRPKPHSTQRPFGGVRTRSRVAPGLPEIHGGRQIARVGLERVDHVDIAAEGREDLFVVGRSRLNDHPQLGIQEARGHGNFQIDLLVGGERHDGLAVGPLQPGLD
jgi:hypothetical protein